MDVRKQLSIFLESRPGTLATLSELLSENDVNILALTVSDTVDHAVVRMIVDKPDEAIHRLEDEGYLLVDNQVAMVELENKPGALAELARTLANHDINIDYAYCTAIPAQQQGLIVLRVRDPEEALKHIESAG